MYVNKFILLNEVESTNNYANQLILSNAADEETVVLTHYQTKGKGQRGNSWESEYGKNLLMSMILFPRILEAGKQFMISKIVSLALVDFLKNETDSVAIKWPNDIFIGDLKVAGILIENSVKGSELFSSVLGIGLNLNQEFFMSDAPNPVSLKQITGKNYEVERVAEEVALFILKWYKKLENNDLEVIDDRYFSYLYRIAGWWKFSKQGNIFEAKISGIGEFGQLILEQRSGEIAEFMFKEVEFVLNDSQ